MSAYYLSSSSITWAEMMLRSINLTEIRQADTLAAHILSSTASFRSKPDNEVTVTFEDQQQINKFARHNAKLQDLKEELDSRKKELQNLEDAADELLMVEDEEEAIPYQIGEVFVLSSLETTNQMLENAKSDLEKDISDLENNCERHKQVLSDLKITLYAKFGNNINLDAEEE